MKEQDRIEQHLDKLTKKVMDSSLESPSADFTANIMMQLDKSVETKTIVYKPPITNWGWMGIAAVVAGIALFVLYGNAEPISWLENVDLSVITNNKVSETVSGITISKIVMYAIILFGASWFVQVQLIKRHVEQRLSY